MVLHWALHLLLTVHSVLAEVTAIPLEQLVLPVPVRPVITARLVQTLPLLQEPLETLESAQLDPIVGPVQLTHSLATPVTTVTRQVSHLTVNVVYVIMESTAAALV